MITTSEKFEIQDRLRQYCEQKGSQNKAANSLNNVSSSTVSKLLNEDWELINEVMWRSIAAQIGVKSKNWNIVETRDYKILMSVLKDAQQNALVMAITGDSGSGKTLAINSYSESNKNVFVLSCNEFWNRKLFLQELLRVMGKGAVSETVGEMMSTIVLELKKMQEPLLVIDEADKLPDQVLYFFITLYNNLEDRCGILMIATDYLEKKIKRGLRLNKKGYKEIYSRLGRKFVQLRGVCVQDVTDICIANNIANRNDIKKVVEDCDNDLRRVKRKVHALNKINNEN